MTDALRCSLSLAQIQLAKFRNLMKGRRESKMSGGEVCDVFLKKGITPRRVCDW